MCHARKEKRPAADLAGCKGKISLHLSPSLTFSRGSDSHPFFSPTRSNNPSCHLPLPPWPAHLFVNSKQASKHLKEESSFCAIDKQPTYLAGCDTGHPSLLCHHRSLERPLPTPPTTQLLLTDYIYLFFDFARSDAPDSGLKKNESFLYCVLFDAAVAVVDNLLRWCWWLSFPSFPGA